ncbi:MAG: hypothetical protein JWM10_781 [Myxococcaceae bacterium]|nr:hypothetical protein [Myxococcaceae bacterium]
MDDPLAGLDDVPWESLRHTCGPPIDTPRRLREIARGEADDRTWSELYASITNQDSVDEASAAAAPFLINLTRVTSGDNLSLVLGLLDAIAAGITREAEVRERCIRAAELGFPRYVELLSAAEPEVRAVAASLVAAYPERLRAVRADFEAALDAEQDPGARAELLANYGRFVDPDDEEIRARLRAFVDDPSPLVAARAGFGLMKSVAHPPAPVWVDAVVRSLVAPASPGGGVDAPDLYVDEVLEGTPTAWRPLLLDALLRAFPEVRDRVGAFDLGGAILWLAFHWRLAGPACPPRPFVFVHSLAHPIPSDRSGVWPDQEDRFLPGVHWRTREERGPDVEFICGPYLGTWDQSLPKSFSAPDTTVTIAQPASAGSLTADERRVMEVLARSDTFWRTDSDLPMVYGLPARRREFAALVGL